MLFTGMSIYSEWRRHTSLYKANNISVKFIAIFLFRTRLTCGFISDSNRLNIENK